MGLDMYLQKRNYVKHWEHKGDDNFEIVPSKSFKSCKWEDPPNQPTLIFSEGNVGSLN